MRPRVVIAVGLVIAFFAALTLANSPRLHEHLHAIRAQHECAATMIASGNCAHVAPLSPVPEIANLPILSALIPREFALVSAVARSSILEHAPPTAH